MDPHRLSQTTLPSTHHSLSSQQQPNTNTSLHNSALSHHNTHLHAQSLLEDSSNRHQAQEVAVAHRTNSQRLAEDQEERREVEQEERIISKSQGQRSGHIDVQQPGQQDKSDMAEEAGKVSASWGGQNLLEGNSSSSQQCSSQKAPINTKSQKQQNAQCSQTSEYLLDFSYPLDQPYIISSKAINAVVVQQRCESQSKLQNKSEQIKSKDDFHSVEIELMQKNYSKQMEIQAKGTYEQQDRVVDNPMEIQDINELRQKAQRILQLEQQGNQQARSQGQNFAISQIQNRPESLQSIQKSDILNSSEAVQLDSQYRCCDQISSEPKQSTLHHKNTQSEKPQLGLKQQSQIDSSPSDRLNSNSSKSKNHSQEYEIEVKEVNDQRINSHIKNNDIYGIQDKGIKGDQLKQKQTNNQICERNHHEIEELAKMQRSYRNSEERENRAVLGGYYDASEAYNTSKGDIVNSKPQQFSAEQKPQESTFNLNETKPTVQSQQPQYQQSFSQNIHQLQPSPKQQQSQPCLSLQHILQIMSALIEDQRSSELRFNDFNKLLSPHIDLMFMRGTDPIGEAILSDGTSAKMFCRLYSLKEEHQKNRRPFERYLVSIIDQKVKSNRDEFEEYRSRFYPQSRIGIVQTHSEKIESKSPQITRQDQAELQPNEHQAKFQQPSETESRINASIEVNQPSVRSGAYSILKSSYKPSQIAQPQTEGPIRRYNLGLSDLQSANKNENLNMSVQPKKTKKTKPARKVKISTTDKQVNKSTVKRDISKQEKKSQKLKKELQRLGADYSKFMKSQEKDQKEVKKQNKKEQHLGSGYTFLQTKDNDHTYLQPVRASHRIQGQSRLKNNPHHNKAKNTRQSQRVTLSSISPKRQQTPPKAHSRSKKNRSSRKTNDFLTEVGEEEYLNVNLIKNYFREINMELPCKFENIEKYTPISKQDSYITDLLLQYKQLHRQEEDLQRDYERSQSAMEGTHDLQELEEITMTNRRIEESQNMIANRKKQIKKKISEYYDTPIEVERIVNPNINNHGIYALLQLTKRSALVFKARYFVTQISCIEYAPKQLIDEDLKTIRMLVEEEQQDNIGSIALNENILWLIEQAKQKKESSQKKSRQNNQK